MMKKRSQLDDADFVIVGTGAGGATSIVVSIRQPRRTIANPSFESRSFAGASLSRASPSRATCAFAGALRIASLARTSAQRSKEVPIPCPR